MELTDAGQDAYRQSKAVLEQVEGLRRAVLKSPAERPPLRITFSEAISMVLAGPLASRLGGPADFQQLDSGESATAVLESKADFGVVFVPFPHSGLEFLAIKNTRMGAYKLKGAFAGRAAEEVPFVVPTSQLERNPLGVRARDGWPEGVARRVCFGASNLGMALGLVEAGVAAAYLPAFLVRALNLRAGKSPGLREIPFSSGKVSSSRRIFLVKRSGVPESREMKALAGLVRMHC